MWRMASVVNEALLEFLEYNSIYTWWKIDRMDFVGVSVEVFINYAESFWLDTYFFFEWTQSLIWCWLWIGH